MSETEEIKLTVRPAKDQIDKLLADGLSSSGATTRACLTSMSMMAVNLLARVAELEKEVAELKMLAKAATDGEIRMSAMLRNERERNQQMVQAGEELRYALGNARDCLRISFKQDTSIIFELIDQKVAAWTAALSANKEK